jgi:hypothetical protein
MSEPMITIKKADGTFAKVPLSEFKKMQASQQKPAEPAKPVSSPSVQADPDHKPVHHSSSHHSTPHHAPAHHKTHTEHAKTVHHPAKHMTRADAGSPLEEKLPSLMVGKTSAPLFSPKREKQVEEVLIKLGFSVAPEVLGRLKSLILAKLKDIKSEEETRELLARSIKNGGLGLAEQQVEKIIKSCWEVDGGADEKEAPVLKGKVNTASEGNSFSAALHSLESELELPAPLAKVNAIATKAEVRDTPRSESLTPKREGSIGIARDNNYAKDEISRLVKSAASSEPVFKLDTRPAMKQSMQDVTASSTEMGPVEEIKSMTLTDFRRLSGNPEEAAKRLQQKMFNLQDESFVWYLEALAAFRLSPLYAEYMQSVCQSLAERKSLANVLSMKNSIKLNEVMALIEMEKGL